MHTIPTALKSMTESENNIVVSHSRSEVVIILSRQAETPG